MEKSPPIADFKFSVTFLYGKKPAFLYIFINKVIQEAKSVQLVCHLNLLFLIFAATFLTG